MADMGTEIIGFDLGHGESALVYTRLNSQTEPQVLEVAGKRPFVSAVRRSADGHVQIGEWALKDGNPGDEAYIRFKSRHFDAQPTVGKAIRLFAGCIAERTRKLPVVQSYDAALTFVGCPSGWSPFVQKAYAALLASAGLPNVRVIPESRAAFLHSRENAEFGISTTELSRRILLIDLGSSTTDFTLSVNLNERPVDTGANSLGGGLLDQMILERALKSAQKAEQINAFLVERPGKRAEIDLKARKVKESYFDAENAGEKTIEITESVMLMKGLYVEIEADKEIIEEMLNRSLTELDGKSWKNSFAEHLATCRSELGSDPDLVILTGGAARMGFIETITRKAYPKARIVRGKEPELAIAKGLAWFGRALVRSERFRAAVLSVVEGDALQQIISRKLPALFERMAPKVAESLISAVVIPKLKAWRDGKIQTLKILEDQEIPDAAEQWLKSKAGKDTITEVTAAWFNEIRPEIHQLTDPICEQYHIPTSALDLPPDTNFSTEEIPSMGNLDEWVLDDLESIGTIINIIGALIIATLLGCGGIALLMSGPIGWIIGFVIGFVALFVGKSAAMEYLKTINVPQIGRNLISDAKISEGVFKGKAEFADKLESAFASSAAKSEDNKEPLANQIATQIGAGLLQRAQDTIIQFS